MRKLSVYTSAFVTALLLAFCGRAAAAVTFEGKLFSDGMVLQQGVIVPVWGRAAPGEQVTVSLAGQQKSATTTPSGDWRVDLDPLAPAGPATMTIEGSNTVSITDVQVGEVWLCGGQSNMALAMPTRAQMAENPAVRALRFGDWSDSPGDICWRFALAINEALQVPVGILNNAKGGARIRTFLPPAVLSDPDPDVQSLVAGYAMWGENWDQFTEHLVPYAMRGVIWWQGEADGREAYQYQELLPALIRAWRNEWNIGDFPFIFVQLPNGKGLPYGRDVARLPKRPSRESWPSVMRQAYVSALSEPNTGMIVTSDLVGGVHPPTPARPEYARRLADAARVLVYGQSFVYSGPVISSAVAEGAQVRIRFLPDTATGLHTGGAPLQGFAVSADHETWVWASAEIDGEEVLVSSPDVPAPVAVRYGYGRRFKWANLYNERDTVAGPFEVHVEPGP